MFKLLTKRALIALTLIVCASSGFGGVCACAGCPKDPFDFPDGDWSGHCAPADLTSLICDVGYWGGCNSGKYVTCVNTKGKSAKIEVPNCTTLGHDVNGYTMKTKGKAEFKTDNNGIIVGIVCVN